jgi:hypothetical protein
MTKSCNGTVICLGGGALKHVESNIQSTNMRYIYPTQQGVMYSLDGSVAHMSCLRHPQGRDPTAIVAYKGATVGKPTRKNFETMSDRADSAIPVACRYMTRCPAASFLAQLTIIGLIPL